MSFWDTVSGYFSGGGGQLQEVTPNYAGMRSAAPTLYDNLQQQRATAPGLNAQLPNYAGHQAAAPNLHQAASQAPLMASAAAMGKALSNIPKSQALAPGRIQSMQGSPSGLLDFYSRDLAAFEPPQSGMGLLSMPRF